MAAAPRRTGKRARPTGRRRRRASGRGRRDGALRMSGVLRKPPALAAGDRRRAGRAGQPVRSRGVRRRRRRAARAGLRTEWDDDPSSSVARSLAGPRRRALSDFDARLAGSRRRRICSASRGGYGSVQIVPSLDPGRFARRRRPSSATAISRSLLTLLIVPVRRRRVPWADRRGTSGRRARARTIGRRSCAALTVAAPMGELDARAAPRRSWPARRAGRLLGGTLTQLAAARGHAVRADAVGRHDPAARGRRRAAVSSRPPRAAAPR